MSRLVPPLTPAQKAAFIEAVRSLLTIRKGKPARFKHEARGPKAIDCIGVPIFGYTEIGCGAMIQDLARYSRNPDAKTLREALVTHLGQPVKISQAEPGDIALMRWFGSKGGPQWFNHVGVLTPYQFGGLALLHSFISKPHNCVIEHNIAVGSEWRSRIREVYRT